MKRALMITGFTSLVSLALLSFLPEKTQWIPAAFFLFFGLVFLLFKKFKSVKYIALILITISVSSFSLWISDCISTKNIEEYNGKERIFSGYVESIYSDGFVLKSKIDGEIYSVYIKTDDTDAFQNGNACRAVGVLITTANMKFSDARYYKSRGCYLVCSPERAYVIKDEGIKYTPKFLKSIWDFREKLLLTCDNIFSEDMSGLMKAIIMGDKRDVPDKIEDDFLTSGFSHYTALSGQHTSIVAALIFFLLKGINRRFAAITTAVSMLFYVFIVGMSFSVTRAGIMAVITYIGMAFFLRSDGLNSLGVSIIVILMFNPYSAADISFQLSVAATIGVIIISPRLDNFFEKLLSKIHPKLKLTPLRRSLATTLGANIILIPYYIFLFEKISLISPLSNLIAGQIMSLPIAFGTPAILIAQIPYVNILAFPLKIIAELSLRLIVIIAKYASLVPFSSVIADQIFVKLWFIGTILAISCIIIFGNKKIIKLSVILSLTSLFSMILCYNIVNKDNLTVSLVSSYSNASVIITDKDSCTVVANKTDDFLLYRIEKELISYGKDEIDLMIIGENEKSIELFEFLDDVNVKTLVYGYEKLYSQEIDIISEKVDKFYNNSQLDIKVGERMNFIIRNDKDKNSIILMKLDEVYISLNLGNYDLMNSYQEIRDIDIFVVGNECPVGIEHFNPSEIFLSNKENAREIYKKIYLLSDNIRQADKQTIIINKNRYKLLN